MTPTGSISRSLSGPGIQPDPHLEDLPGSGIEYFYLQLTDGMQFPGGRDPSQCRSKVTAYSPVTPLGQWSSKGATQLDERGNGIEDDPFLRSGRDRRAPVEFVANLPDNPFDCVLEGNDQGGREIRRAGAERPG